MVLKPAKDAAEFFANKKRRGFKKFNANLIDISAVSSDVHVNAPALSSAADETEPTTIVPTTATWSNPSSVKPTILATEQQVRTLELAEDPNVVEKVELEETKAKLAKAREGMERQAAAAAAAAASKKTAAAPVPGSRWMGARMRQSQQSSPQQQFDIANAQLFPDLGAAAAKPNPSQQRKPKLAPRPKKAKAPAKPPMVKPSDMEKPKQEEATKPAPPPPTMKEIVAPSAPEPKIVKKKKKKDVSTFKK